MSFLETWVATPLAQALGWTLLHSLWEGAIVAAGLAAALWAFGSSRIRYVMACVALMALAGAVSLTFIRIMPERVQSSPGAEIASLPRWNIPPDVSAAGASGFRLAAVVPWLAPFWMAGVWISAFVQMAGWIGVTRLGRRGVCCAPEHWQREIERLGARLRLSRPVRILESCLVDMPMVVGHIRPLILMPVGLLAGLPPAQMEAILLHELAHIRRHDYLVNIVQRVVECFLFYHPAVWWISRVIRTERENCCDDVVVATQGAAQQYAVALTTLAQIRSSAGTPALAATGGSLVKRIHRLLYPKHTNGFWTPFFAAAIVITVAVATLAAWPRESARQAAPGKSAETVLVPGTLQLKPFPTQPLAHFVFKQNSREAIETLARLADLKVTFAPDFKDQPVSMDLSNVKIEDALREVCRQTNSFWKPVASDAILVVPNKDAKFGNSGGASEVGAYDRWLNEEVVYIIADQERVAFKSLTTDEEREKFVEQFWARRNPVPGSPENKFREEHYRRLAYANEHFASSTKPGWKTDRGYTHIVYGPPDQIDQWNYGSALGPHVPYGIQLWTYRHVDGVGDNLSVQFIDTTGKGDYGRAAGPTGEGLPFRSKDHAQLSTYDRWLNEEVVYIITDQERDQFLKLTTDEERKKFVAQFWERRNPHPGSPGNEFKEDYYRRIAYANEHWATDKPGWKTDRGHTYILYGPADEIESHPVGPPYPFEQWMYKHLEKLGENVIFTFVDPDWDGSYRTAPEPPVVKKSTSP